MADIRKEHMDAVLAFEAHNDGSGTVKMSQNDRMRMAALLVAIEAAAVAAERERVVGEFIAACALPRAVGTSDQLLHRAIAHARLLTRLALNTIDGIDAPDDSEREDAAIVQGRKLAEKLRLALGLRPVARATAPTPERIYVASKTRHAPMWRALRAAGAPISSSWIDEAGEHETQDWPGLWQRCLDEIRSCNRLIAYAEDGDVLRGAFFEMGAAAALGKPIVWVGPRSSINLLRQRGIAFATSVRAALCGLSEHGGER